MLSSITTSPGFSSGLASATPASEDASATASNDDAADNAESPAYQITLSAEAGLTLSISQTTKITISQASGEGEKPGAALDPNTDRALSTLEAVAEHQREWIAELKAESEGKAPKTAQSAEASTTAKGSANANPPSELQVTIEQDTEVDVSLSVAAQVDVQA